MTFKEATDALDMTAVELAEVFGVSPATIRQARLEPGASGYRSPPEGWQRVVAKLIRQRRRDLDRMAEQLEKSVRP